MVRPAGREGRSRRPLLPRRLSLAKRLEDVTLHVAKDMPHNAPIFAAYHPSGKAALDAVATFVRDRLGA